MSHRLPGFRLFVTALLYLGIAVLVNGCGGPEVRFRDCGHSPGGNAQELVQLSARNAKAGEAVGCLSLSSESDDISFDNVRYSVSSEPAGLRVATDGTHAVLLSRALAETIRSKARLAKLPKASDKDFRLAGGASQLRGPLNDVRVVTFRAHANGGLRGPCTFGCSTKVALFVVDDLSNAGRGPKGAPGTAGQVSTVTKPVSKAATKEAAGSNPGPVAPSGNPTTGPALTDRTDNPNHNQNDNSQIDNGGDGDDCLLTSDPDAVSIYPSVCGLPVVAVGQTAKHLRDRLLKLPGQIDIAMREAPAGGRGGDPNAGLVCAPHDGDGESYSVKCEPCIKDLRTKSLIDWYRERYPDYDEGGDGDDLRGPLKSALEGWKHVSSNRTTDEGVPTRCFTRVTLVKSQARDYTAYARYYLRENKSLWDTDGKLPNPNAITTAEPLEAIIYKVEWKITFHDHEAWLMVQRRNAIDQLAAKINAALNARNPGGHNGAWTPRPKLVDFAGDPHRKGPDLVYTWKDRTCTKKSCAEPDGAPNLVGARMRVAFEPTDNSIAVELTLGGLKHELTQELWERARKRYLYGQVLRYATTVAQGEAPAAGKDAPGGR
jgi:hypothetical protein